MVDDWGTTFLTSGTHFEIKLEDFVFLHVLGQGQYGTVYLARHHPTDTLMALKVCCFWFGRFFLFAVLPALLCRISGLTLHM